jgi:pre-mRNA 3'-end-processing factor FIP1
MPEEQLAALPPEIRSMVMASATTFMTNGGANPAMMPQNVGMPMMGEMGMNMPQMSMMNDINGMQMGMQEVTAPGVQGQLSQDSGEGFGGQMMGMMGGEYGMQVRISVVLHLSYLIFCS